MKRRCTIPTLFLLPLLLFGVAIVGHTQDIQFSQYYAAPLYLNPAFAGSAHHHRLITHNRLQWPNLESKYTTVSASYDTYFNHYRSGLGISVLNDQQGAGSISSTEIHAQYSYELHMHDNYTFRFGIEAGYMRRIIDLSDRTFPNQYNNDGLDASIANGEISALNKNMLDLGTGGVFYSKHAWLGIAAHHINSPNQSFYGQASRFPAKLSLMGGYKILFNQAHHAFFEDIKETSITPTFFYKHQGGADQLDLGTYLNYGQILFGVWYRGIPFKKYDAKLPNNESIVALLGWHFEHFSVGYSYDFVISKLTQARPFGAHELNLTYIFYKEHKGAKPMKKLPCPNFYKHFSLD